MSAAPLQLALLLLVTLIAQAVLPSLRVLIVVSGAALVSRGHTLWACPRRTK